MIVMIVMMMMRLVMYETNDGEIRFSIVVLLMKIVALFSYFQINY